AAAALEAATDTDRAKNARALDKAQKDRVKAEKTLQDAIDQRDSKTRERDDLKALLQGGPGPAGAGTAAPAAPSGAEQEDLAYASRPPDPALLVPSKFRPYYLKPFKVQADNMATKLCTNFSEYRERFGGFSAFKAARENPIGDPSAWTFKPLYPGHH